MRNNKEKWIKKVSAQVQRMAQTMKLAATDDPRWIQTLQQGHEGARYINSFKGVSEFQLGIDLGEDRWADVPMSWELARKSSHKELVIHMMTAVRVQIAKELGELKVEEARLDVLTEEIKARAAEPPTVVEVPESQEWIANRQPYTGDEDEHQGTVTS